MAQKCCSDFKNSSFYKTAVYILIGIGIGALLTYPVFGTHPVKWGVGLIALGILGHLYPVVVKK